MGTRLGQLNPQILRAKRPSMDGQCGWSRRARPKCNVSIIVGEDYKGYESYEAMNTAHSACLLAVSPSSPLSIMRSARSCLACPSNLALLGFE